MNDLLQQAIDTVKAGDRDKARELLVQVIQADPHTEDAWLWLAKVIDEPARKRECYQRVLAINPNNDAAQREMMSCGEQATAPSNRAWDIDNLDGHEFELLVVRLLKKMGLQVEETKRTGDGGIDAIARSEEPITGGLFVIQCKRYSSSVGVPKVRDLYGVVNHVNASRGILITNSDFTRQAKEFAEGKPIELVNGDMLKGLLVKHGVEKAIPEGKKLAIFSRPHKRLLRGLLSIADKIDTKLEADSLLISSGAVVLYPKVLFGIVRRNDGIVRRNEGDHRIALENLARAINAVFDKDVDTLSDGYVDYWLKVIRDLINDMLRHRKAIIDMRVESEYVPLKQAIIEVLSAPLTQIAHLMKEAYRKLEELDGELVDEDFQTLQLAWKLNLDEQEERARQELERLERKEILKPDLRTILLNAIMPAT